jgi:hypothetical protein
MNKSAVDALLSSSQAWETYRRSLKGQRPDLTGANLTNANLSSTNLTSANFTSADLTNANLAGADLTSADLTNVILTSANFTSANLTNANLAFADLTRAKLIYANLTNANLASAKLTNADLTGTDITRAKVTANTITSAGQSVRSALQGESVPPPLDVGVIRLQWSLPPTIDPQSLADLTSSVAVMTRLASRVGSRLGRGWLEDSSSGSSGTLRVETDSRSSSVKVLRTHYGSPLWMDLIEYGLPILAGGAATGGAAFVLRKEISHLVSFLVMLVRPAERKPFFESRVERGRRDLERERANTAGEKERRFRSEAAIIRLQIPPMSEAELGQHILEATSDPEARSDMLNDVPQLMPLVREGITVFIARDIEI